MSKFFRSGSTSSDSSHTDEEHTEENHTEDISHSDTSLHRHFGNISLDFNHHARPVVPTGASAGQDLLIHALLEERCRNQVMRDSRFNTESGIQRETQRRYRLLCQQLAPYNLVSTGLDDDRYISTRQSVRDQLDRVTFTEESAALQLHTRTARIGSPLPAPLRRLLTEGDAPPIPSSPASIFDGHSPHPVADTSPWYAKHFEELGPLGRGGYGGVFRARHFLDQRIYAVKKVPIKPSTLARLQSGQASTDDILREVRILSKLDHPNVVRYYYSWLEWSTGTGLISSSSEPTSAIVRDSGHHADETTSMSSLGRVRTESDTNTVDIGGIAFESQSRSIQDVSTPSVPIEESDMPSSLHSNGALLPTSTMPLLTLHMQMDVYPMTLADFIEPKPTGTEIAPLSHCFHLETSIRIVLAILEGVEYIHAEDIVHRDLKPANIFLRHEENPRATRSTVDLFLCSTCRNENKAQPAQLSVRIGDFGLVTNIAETATVPSSPGVGTAMYRPIAATSNVSPRLDIFAMGIIACELLCKFDTQSERRQKLDGLRRGRCPDFAACPSHQIAKVQEVIKAMLTDQEISIAQVKERFSQLLEREEGLRSPPLDGTLLRRVST